MKKSSKKKKLSIFLTVTALTLIGTYNALVMNGDSSISDSGLAIKRLDELQGTITSGRSIAVSTKWEKVSVVAPTVAKSQLGAPAQATSGDMPSAPVIEAAIQESLNLSLTELVNPRLWKNGVDKTAFNGSIATNDGVIESLNITFPQGQKIDVSFAEMIGNVFEYDLNGQVFSGMLYQVDSNVYMVTLTNGPLEGSRLRFETEASTEHKLEDAQNFLADTHHVQPGTFGEDQVQQPLDQVEAPVTETAAFNFGNTQSI